VDPLEDEYPWNSTYAFAENMVIECSDLEGLEAANRVMVVGGDGTNMISPDQSKVASLTSHNQRNQQCFTESELSKLKESQWRPAGGKFDQNWYNNTYKTNKGAINDYLDGKTASAVTNPTLSSSTVGSTGSKGTVAPGGASNLTVVAPQGEAAPSLGASSSENPSIQEKLQQMKIKAAKEDLDYITSIVSNINTVTGAIESAKRFAYRTQAGNVKFYNSSSSSLLAQPDIVKTKQLGKLKYISDVKVKRLSDMALNVGAQTKIGNSLKSTGKWINAGKWMGPAGSLLSLYNAWQNPSLKNRVGAAFDVAGFVVGMACPPAGYAISLAGWFVGQSWPEPPKPKVEIKPCAPEPSDRLRRMPSDRLNTYSPMHR